MERIPHEFVIGGGVYLDPILVAILISILLAVVVLKMLNKYRLSKYFSNRPLAFLSIVVIFTFLVKLLFISF